MDQYTGGHLMHILENWNVLWQIDKGKKSPTTCAESTKYTSELWVTILTGEFPGMNLFGDVGLWGKEKLPWLPYTPGI